MSVRSQAIVFLIVTAVVCLIFGMMSRNKWNNGRESPTYRVIWVNLLLVAITKCIHSLGTLSANDDGQHVPGAFGGSDMLFFWFMSNWWGTVLLWIAAWQHPSVWRFSLREILLTTAGICIVLAMTATLW